MSMMLFLHYLFFPEIFERLLNAYGIVTLSYIVYIMHIFYIFVGKLHLLLQVDIRLQRNDIV